MQIVKEAKQFRRAAVDELGAELDRNWQRCIVSCEDSSTDSLARFENGVLLVALVYVAYPFISTVPTFFSELRTANWWWALLGLVISASTYLGAAAALWASADESVNFWKLSIAQVANTFAATDSRARSSV